MSLSVSASLLPLTSSAFSFATRLCVALPPLLVSVSVAVVVVVLARLLVWFGVADVFAGNRGRRWWWAGFGFGLGFRAFVFV